MNVWTTAAKTVLAFCFLATSGYAMAEGGHCPPGFYPISSPGVMGCAPIPGYGDGSQSSQPVPQEWQTRWGAIAVDGGKGSLGTAVGMQSEGEAVSAAMMECRAKGGDNCEVDLTYHNQCGVMILGSSKLNTASAATIEEATQVGMKTCAAADTNCRVYYSDCSYPVRTR
jgi:hypothetical protein